MRAKTVELLKSMGFKENREGRLDRTFVKRDFPLGGGMLQVKVEESTELAIAPTRTLRLSICFTGQEYDSSTGLHSKKFRDEDGVSIEAEIEDGLKAASFKLVEAAKTAAVMAMTGV